VVEGWVRLNLPTTDEAAAAAEAAREALRAGAPRMTTPTLPWVEDGRDPAGYDPEDLATAIPAGRPYPEWDAMQELLPGTQARPRAAGAHLRQRV